MFRVKAIVSQLDTNVAIIESRDGDDLELRQNVVSPEQHHLLSKV
jgi:hypothetical protein